MMRDTRHNLGRQFDIGWQAERRGARHVCLSDVRPVLKGKVSIVDEACSIGECEQLAVMSTEQTASPLQS